MKKVSKGSDMESKESRKGRSFDPVDEPSSSESQTSSQGRVFTPDPQVLSDQLPQSIEHDLQSMPLSSGYFQLEKLPIKGLKGFLYSLLGVLGIIGGYEIWQIFDAALQTHWSLAAGFSAVVALFAGFTIKTVRSFFSDQDIQLAGDLQAMAVQSQLENSSEKNRSHAARAQIIHNLQQLYAGKPQAKLLQQALDSLPDYADDLETIQHIEQHFLKPLDQQAIKLISEHALTTGTVVAMSPWVSLDILFSLYRNTKMLSQIGQIYGLRPSMANRWRLMRSVINHLALAGTSEALLDQLMGETGLASLASLSASRVMQGLGLGVYTGRIGLSAIKACRPIEFAVNEQPKLKNLLKPLLKKIGKK